MINILVTGAKGFVGKNLCASLKNIRDGKDRTRPNLHIGEIYEYDIDTDPSLLAAYCSKVDFVFHLAGVNRPQNTEEFMQGNFGFASTLLDTLKKQDNTCPVMISSSIQATCIVTMAEARKRARNSFLLMAKKPAPRCLSTGSRTSSASGADQTITPRLPLFATI